MKKPFSRDACEPKSLKCTTAWERKKIQQAVNDHFSLFQEVVTIFHWTELNYEDSLKKTQSLIPGSVSRLCVATMRSFRGLRRLDQGE